MTFDTLGLHPDLVRAVRELGFTEPTPIQQKAIPIALEAKDLLACAMTGSGKTAAFILPTLDYLMSSKGKGRGPRALVVTPTRELAAQVADDMKALARFTKLRGAAIYGGVGMAPQERAFRDRTDVLVATPGRLLDHLQHRYATLADVEILVLDEADRMLDMGFLPDIRRILGHVPDERQTLFFSATMPQDIAKLAREMLYKPETIAVERQSKPATGVRQRVFPVSKTEKARLLLDVLAREDVRSALVFTRTKRRANRVCEYLEKYGVAAARIHGNRSQAQREKALAAFRRGTARVLVATDIAARGIDIDDLSHVINFDVPNMAEDYIHRVGRTARANRTGDAFTFVSPDEEADLKTIEAALKKKLDREKPFRPENARPMPAPVPKRPSSESSQEATAGGPGRRSRSRSRTRTRRPSSRTRR